MKKAGIWARYLLRRYCAWREIAVLEGSVDRLAGCGLLLAVDKVPEEWSICFTLNY